MAGAPILTQSGAVDTASMLALASIISDDNPLPAAANLDPDHDVSRTDPHAAAGRNPCVRHVYLPTSWPVTALPAIRLEALYSTMVRDRLRPRGENAKARRPGRHRPAAFAGARAPW